MSTTTASSPLRKRQLMRSMTVKQLLRGRTSMRNVISASKSSLSFAAKHGSSHGAPSLGASTYKTGQSTTTFGGSVARNRAEHQLQAISVFRNWTHYRLYAYDIVESKYFGAFILGVILLNTVLITFQSDRVRDTDQGFWFAFVDSLFLGIYIFEICLKFYVWHSDFFESGWNNFDLFIVLMSCFEVIWLVVIGSLAGFNPKIFRLLRVFRAIRAFRALRVLRTITFFQNLQIIVTTLLRSIPAWGSISLLLLLVLYIFGIIGVTLYGSVHPDKFGDIWRSMFSLFQLITLDDWFETYNAIKDSDKSIIVYLIVFIVLETFIFINLFIAVIVNNLETLQRRNLERLQRKLDKKSKRRDRLRRRQMQHENEYDQRRSLRAAGDSNPNDDNDNNVGGGGGGGVRLEPKRRNGSDRWRLNKLDDQGYDADHLYDSFVTNTREKQAMTHVLQLLASLENSMDRGYEHNRTLEDLVDIAFPIVDESTSAVVTIDENRPSSQRASRDGQNRSDGQSAAGAGRTASDSTATARTLADTSQSNVTVAGTKPRLTATVKSKSRRILV